MTSTAAEHEYVVNLHVHTTYSDGTGAIEDVIGAARRAGLDVLMINDHDTINAKVDGHEGYHGRVMVIVGVEFSGPHNHYLAYGIESAYKYNWQSPQETIDRVKAAGGIGVIAHPFEKGSPLSEGGRAYTWEDWSVNGFDGLCIWNYSSSWKEKIKALSSGFFYYVFHTQTLAGPDGNVLAKWDELGRIRRVAGLGGSDVHAAKVKLFGRAALTIFPYEDAFQAINTHLLLSDPLTGHFEQDKQTVLSALAAGSCFLVHDRLSPGRGFEFHLENMGQRRAGQGEEVSYEDGDVLAWRLPGEAFHRLIHNGRVIYEALAGKGAIRVYKPGVYRLEADWKLPLFGRRPWLFSNPIYIR
jgi:hypothetical protein